MMGTDVFSNPVQVFFWVILSPQGMMNMKHEEGKDEED